MKLKLHLQKTFGHDLGPTLLVALKLSRTWGQVWRYKSNTGSVNKDQFTGHYYSLFFLDILNS